MAVSIKDLRYRMRYVLKSLQRGERPTITYRGSPIAKIIPISSGEKKLFRAIGFGMWKDHSATKDASQWLDEQRKPRFAR